MGTPRVPISTRDADETSPWSGVAGTVCQQPNDSTASRKPGRLPDRTYFRSLRYRVSPIPVTRLIRPNHTSRTSSCLPGRLLTGVRERRLALGLSQTEVAARAGMTQPALSRLEAGGTVPTIPVLERIATALGAELIVTIAPPAA